MPPVAPSGAVFSLESVAVFGVGRWALRWCVSHNDGTLVQHASGAFKQAFIFLIFFAACAAFLSFLRNEVGSQKRHTDGATMTTTTTMPAGKKARLRCGAIQPGVACVKWPCWSVEQRPESVCALSPDIFHYLSPFDVFAHATASVNSTRVDFRKLGYVAVP